MNTRITGHRIAVIALGLLIVGAIATLIMRIPEEPTAEERTPQAESSPSNSADRQRLEELIGQIRKDYEARTARIRARAALPRNPLHGDGEPGNAWACYRMAFDIIRSINWQDRNVLFDLTNETTLKQLTEPKRRTLEQRRREIVTEYRKAVDVGLLGTRRPLANRYEGYSNTTVPLTECHVSQMIATQIVIECETKGDMLKAIEIMMDTILFSHDIMRNGTVIDTVVSIVVQKALIMENIPRILARQNLPLDILVRLSRDLGTLVNNQPSVFDTIDPTIADTELQQLDESTSRWNQRSFRWEKPIPPLTDDEIQEKIASAVQCLDYVKNLDGLRKKERIFHSSYREFQESLASGLSDYGKSTFDAIVVNQAVLEGAQIAVALKRYRLEQGGFPARVDDLYTGGYLPALPKDPFTGEGWKYAVAPDGRSATVWSVGPNFRDDGGIDKRREEKDDIPFTVR